jgi:hypothetical protein
VRKAVIKPVTPMRDRIGVAECGLHPDFAVAHLDRACRGVVRPQVEGVAASEIEARMVPITDQDAVLDAAALEGGSLYAGIDCRAKTRPRSWTIRTGRWPPCS